jgi:hypothetical protein
MARPTEEQLRNFIKDSREDDPLYRPEDDDDDLDTSYVNGYHDGVDQSLENLGLLLDHPHTIAPPKRWKRWLHITWKVIMIALISMLAIGWVYLMMTHQYARAANNGFVLCLLAIDTVLERIDEK